MAVEPNVTALATREAEGRSAAAPAWTAAQIELIKSQIAKDATDDEFRLFLEIARASGLNPFLREIWFIKYRTREGKPVGPVIMTGRDGYLAIANKHPGFEGIQSFAVCADDEFGYDAETGHVTHRFGARRGALVGAWARVKRRGRDPVVAYASVAEYRGTSEPWQKYPSAMVCKVAEAMALKRQFAISGLVTHEELDLPSTAPTPRALPANAANLGRGEGADGRRAPVGPDGERSLPLSAERAANLGRMVRKIAADQGFAAAAADDWIARRAAALGKGGLAELTLQEGLDLYEAAREADFAAPPAPPPAPPADEAFAAL